MLSPVLVQMYKHEPTIKKWMQDDPEATTLVIEVCRIIHVWDDLIDKDAELTPVDINDAFWSLFFTLPTNGFYMRYFRMLNPILMMADINWRTANKFEADGGEHDHQIAYIIRSAYADFVVMCAMLVGGRQWAYKVAPEIRKWVHKETFEEYMSDYITEGEG